MKYDIIIGIDPDVDKSGVATLCLAPHKNQFLMLETLQFPHLLDYLFSLKERAKKIIIIVEAGYLIKTNWHTVDKKKKNYSAAIGNKTGRNHEVAKKIVEMCNHYGLNVVEKKPLIKHWKGKEGKITHNELAYFTGITCKSTNQEQRDAALIAWDYANLPVKIKI